MRRVLVALGILAALLGALILWPLGRIVLTHEHGHARALAVYRDELGSDTLRLRVVWEAQVAPGHWLIADRQSDQMFRPTSDPVLNRVDAEAVAARILPDAQGSQLVMPVFWKANDPGSSAFIIDVSASHWFRRYFAGAAIVLAGLLVARLAWRR